MMFVYEDTVLCLSEVIRRDGYTINWRTIFTQKQSIIVLIHTRDTIRAKTRIFVVVNIDNLFL